MGTSKLKQVDVGLNYIKDYNNPMTSINDINGIYYAFQQCKEVNNILEIGTSRGYTTKVLSETYPKGTIYTIDHDKESGELIKDKSNVIQICSNSSEYKHNVIFDCILIDADHYYDGVKNDLLNVLDNIKEGSVIAFHDVSDTLEWEGINRFLDELVDLGIEVYKVTNSIVAYIVFDYSNFILINKIKQKYTENKIEIKEVITMNDKYYKLSGIPSHDVDYLIEKGKQQQSIGAFIEFGSMACGVSYGLACETNQKAYAFDKEDNQNIPEHARLKFFKGDIKDTIKEVLNDSYSIVFFDLDEYDITKYCIEYLLSNKHVLNKGCLFIFHDYNWSGCPGINKVVDEVMKNNADFKELDRYNYFAVFEYISETVQKPKPEKKKPVVKQVEQELKEEEVKTVEEIDKDLSEIETAFD